MNKPVIEKFTQIGEIFIHKYERYLPTAFDESLTILEKMNKIIEYMNQVGSTVNNSFDKWNEVMQWIMNDGLSQEVVDKLDQMINDGSLEDLINVELLGSRARIIVSEDTPLNPDSQLHWYQIVGTNPSFNIDGSLKVDESQVTYKEE